MGLGEVARGDGVAMMVLCIDLGSTNERVTCNTQHMFHAFSKVIDA